MPTTRKVLVDRDAVLDLVDQLRVAIPEEVRAAKRINAEGERIIEKANEEAARIVGRAQEQAAFLIGERGLTEAAQAEGRQIIDEAEAGRTAPARRRRVRRPGPRGPRGRGRKMLAGIQKGIDVLDDRRAEIRGDEPASRRDGDDAKRDDDDGDGRAEDGRRRHYGRGRGRAARRPAMTAPHR